MDHSITQALQNWVAGDELAGAELDRLLRAQLLAIVRHRRHAQYRARIDSEGVVNAAMKSFLSGAAKDEFPVLGDRHDARRLLTRFAICVLKDEIRRLQRGKRSFDKESRLDPGLVATSREASPEECVIAMEYWEKFPEVVRHVHEKAIDILEMRLEGLSNIQVAEKLGLGVRMIQTIVKRMESAWNDWLAAEHEDDNRANTTSGGGT